MNVEIPFEDAIRFAIALRKLWIDHRINDPVLRELERTLVERGERMALEMHATLKKAKKAKP